jgi:hypothetical protein
MSTVTLNWNFPSVDVNGNSLPASDALSGAIFDSASATPSVAIGTVPGAPGAAVSFTTLALSAGTHNFTEVTTDTTTGFLSVASNVFTATITTPEGAPAAVTNLTGTINP